ncbi:hypothetical protein Y032_0080g1336 [Ancylostoma ceylanicum]|uniref:Uncharacterized protein n=1 Tax=Ancylostoma ceylanicum TaxID=53326 RepID=A0A016TTL3_9BILA|nr:hypothetical protein Y032_0080g1336 [Ancylostoma ceylanicum]
MQLKSIAYMDKSRVFCTVGISEAANKYLCNLDTSAQLLRNYRKKKKHYMKGNIIRFQNINRNEQSAP